MNAITRPYINGLNIINILLITKNKLLILKNKKYINIAEATTAKAVRPQAKYLFSIFFIVPPYNIGPIIVIITLPTITNSANHTTILVIVFILFTSL